METTYSYEEYAECLKQVDAVYIALPNSMHCEYALRAARAGVHVLVEKPMAVTEEECEEMNRAAREAGVKLMVAYRLHFERANLEAGEIARSGRIGEPRVFNSTFCTPVVPGNIRVKKDLAVACSTTSASTALTRRALFRDEPHEVEARTSGALDEVEESVSAVLRFSNERIASFTASFGAAKVSEFRLAGTKGDLALEPAYDYAKPSSTASP